MAQENLTPHTVTLVVLPGATLLTLASVLDPMRAANRLSETLVFQWRIVSPDGGDVTITGGLQLSVTGALEAHDAGDTLIVIASFDHDISAPRPFLQKLMAASSRFERVIGVEAGPWLLARAGVIQRQRVTTHFEDLESLQSRFPELDVCDERYVVDGRIWTSGGASPSLDMMLDLTARMSPLLAMEVASVFVYDQAHAASERQAQISLGLFEQAEPKLGAAIRIMERTVDTPLSTSVIAMRLGVSLRKLELLFRDRLAVSPGAYYLRLRLQSARKMVLDTRFTMQDIAVRTGFGSQSAFSRSFKRQFGSSPLQMRQGKKDQTEIMPFSKAISS